MIHVASVHELVQQEIAHDLGRLKHEAAVQTDGSAGRAASPARALPADRNPSIRIAESARAFGERRDERDACALPEPAAQGAVREACNARISDQAEDPGRNRAHAQRAAAAREMHAPALPTGGELNRARGKGLGSSGATLGLSKLSLDPYAVAVHELCYGAPRGAPRDHDFNASGVKYTHGEPACAATFTHCPGLCDGIVRPQGQLRWGIVKHHWPAIITAVRSFAGRRPRADPLGSRVPCS